MIKIARMLKYRQDYKNCMDSEKKQQEDKICRDEEIRQQIFKNSMDAMLLCDVSTTDYTSEKPFGRRIALFQKTF